MNVPFEQTLDIRGAKCPMPLVKGSQAINELPIGSVLKVIATERGSLAIQGLAMTAKNVKLVGRETTREDGTPLYVHYLRRTR